MTSESTNGAKTTRRSRRLPRSRALSSTARPSAIGSCKASDSPMMIALCLTDPRNTGSCSARR
jgi:hypothetical protein